MSNEDDLQKEIEYWSELIQHHKEASRKKVVRPENANSKYSWKSSSAGPPNSYAYRTSNHGNERKRQYMGSSHSAHVLKKTVLHTSTLPQTTTVSFNPKFKWTKTTSQVQSPLKPTSKITVKAVAPTQTLGAASNGMSSSPRVFQSKPAMANEQYARSTAQSKYKYQKTEEGKNNVRAPSLVTSKVPPPKHKLKWSRDSSAEATSKRTAPISDTQHASSKWTAHKPSHQKKVNPYKLNRVDSSATRNSKRASGNAIAAKKLYRSRNRVLDRRNKVKHTAHSIHNKSVVEGVHVHRHVPTVKQILANRVVKTHQAAMLKKSEKRQHCLYFGRFGKCMRGDDCKFIHDPSRIAVCTRFLRGTCRDESCSFSHKLEKEKTPACLHFLKGKCNQTDCPYLHVFLGKNAPVCRRFATTGYCPDAEKCKMQHIKCCPDFYDNGSCPKENVCKLPHIAKKTHSTKLPKHQRRNNGSDETEKPATSQASTSSDFLSLKVESPLPINKPFKEPVIHIKPRLGKIKPKM